MNNKLNKIIETCQTLGIEQIDICPDCGNKMYGLKPDAGLSPSQLSEVDQLIDFEPFEPEIFDNYHLDLVNRIGLIEFSF